VTAESVADGLAGLGIPEPDLSSAMAEERVSFRPCLEPAPHFESNRTLTVLSMLPVATVLSMPSHSTQSSQPVWPVRVETGVSVSKFHRRQVLSPEPVARSFPVGEKEAQRMGEACPGWSERVSSSPRSEERTARRLTIDTTTTPSDLPNLEDSLGLALDDEHILSTHNRRMLQEQVGVNRVVDGDARIGVGQEVFGRFRVVW
jgi:hypothetical protein